MLRRQARPAQLLLSLGDLAVQEIVDHLACISLLQLMLLRLLLLLLSEAVDVLLVEFVLYVLVVLIFPGTIEARVEVFLGEVCDHEVLNLLLEAALLLELCNSGGLLRTRVHLGLEVILVYD